MTLGVSNNISGTAGSLAGAGLSNDGAVAAQNFLNALLGQGGDNPRSGGESFLADVKEARNPDEKRALIDGFAEGFAAASQGSAEGADAATGTPTGAQADPTAGTDGAAPAGQTDATGAAAGNQSSASPQDLMQGFKEIADRIAESDLPNAAKNTLLDDIATMMSKLQGQAQTAAGGAGQPSTAGANATPASPQSADPTSGSAPSADATSGNSGSDEVWTHEVKDGQATIRLGDKYTIKADEKDASWTVTNNETGKTTKVSGDPHVDSNGDGKNDFDFKKDMTFKLDDGTKITVGTVPGGDNGATYSSSLTITNGANAMQVTGLGDSHDGENNLEVTQSMEGSVVDQLANDGSNTIYENGGAWVTGGGNPVDQAYIDRAEAMAG